MNVRDKLDVFSRLVMNEAEEKRGDILAEVADAFKTACDEAERKARKGAEEAVRKERYKIEQMKNRELIAAEAEAKKRLIEMRSLLLERLRGGVEQKLRQFAASGEYEAFLMETVKRCAEQYGHIQVRLMERDMVFAEKIRAETGVDVAQAAEDYIGGFKAVVQGGRALLDQSFASRLDAEMKDFNQFKITKETLINSKA